MQSRDAGEAQRPGEEGRREGRVSMLRRVRTEADNV